MKKALSLVIGSTFLVGFAATSAFASHPSTVPAETSIVVGSNAVVKMDGSLRFRGYSKSTDTAKDSAAAEGYDTRVRLGIKATLSDQASGYIQLETGDDSADAMGWGSDLTTTANPLTNGGQKSTDELNILQAWINYDAGMVGVKVGHMPLALGNKLFFDHSGSGGDAIVLYADPNANTHIGALTIKLAEGTSTSNSGDDLDAYVVLIKQKAGAMTIGADLTWLNIDSDYFNQKNLGANIAGKAGAVSFKADVEYQFGDVDSDGNLGTDPAVDFAGYALLAEANMKAGAMTVGGLIGYGSGEDDSNDLDAGNFVPYLTDTRYQSTMVGYVLPIPSLGTDGVNTQKNTGLANMMLVQLNANTKTTCPITKKDLSLKARLNYMTLNETAVGWEDDLGVELEAFATWKLSNGLSYGIEAAYLLAGDAYKKGNAAADVDDAYFLRNSLTLSF